MILKAEGLLRRRKKQVRKGVAAVEFAVVLPIFLVLVFGIFEFGRGFMVSQLLTNTARRDLRPRPFFPTSQPVRCKPWLRMLWPLIASRSDDNGLCQRSRGGREYGQVQRHNHDLDFGPGQQHHDCSSRLLVGQSGRRGGPCDACDRGLLHHVENDVTEHERRPVENGSQPSSRSIRRIAAPPWRGRCRVGLDCSAARCHDRRNDGAVPRLLVKEVLNNASYKGCVTGTAPLCSNATITAAIKGILTDHNINADQATITILVNGSAIDARLATKNDKLSVVTSIPFSAVAWTKAYMFISSSQLQSETVVMLRSS